MEHIRELLENYRLDQAKIKDLELQIESIKSEKYGSSLNGIDYSRDKVSSGKIANPTENIILDIEKNCTVMEQEKKQIERRIKRIENALGELTEEQGEVLRLRYIDRNKRREKHTWREIAGILHTSRMTCIRLHDKGLEKMDEIIYKEERK